MAITATTNLIETGLLLNNSYIRISKFEAEKDKLLVYVDIFASKEARDSNLLPVASKVVEGATYQIYWEQTPTGGNSYPSLYSFLKGVPEFTGAVDC